MCGSTAGLGGSFSRCAFATTALLLFTLTIGCGPSLPEIVAVSGKITVAGKPLANVEVKFTPTIKGLDGNCVARGVTDGSGRYTLTLPGKDSPGAYACAAKVTITEGPMPDEVRNGENSQMAATEYLEGLKNRPIPKLYTRLGDTPLDVVVGTDLSDFDFDLKR